MKHVRYPLIGIKELYEIVKPTGLIPETEWIETLELLVCNEDLPKKYAPRGGGGSNFSWSNNTREFQFNCTNWTMILGTEMKSGKHQWNIKLKKNGSNWKFMGTYIRSCKKDTCFNNIFRCYC